MRSHYINGQWLDGEGLPFTVHDPSTGAHIWTGRAATPAEVNAACAAARAGFAQWARRDLQERIDVCTRFRDLLKEQAENLATLIALEVGKPLWEARTEVASMAGKIDISVRAHGERSGERKTATADGDAMLRHRPHGVFGVFGPYNFPGHLPNGHIVPALIAGNAVVFKPSEYAPQTAIMTAALWEQAGLPQGVLNLLSGGRDTGVVLARHSELDGILFTGSYQTGAVLHAQYAGRPEKMLALEMGGNNPLIAWDVAQIDAAVHHIVVSAFISAGQRCSCARRLIVEDAAGGQALLDRLVDVAAAIRIGRFDASPAPFMGPVVSAQIAERLVGVQSELLGRGGRALLAMRHLEKGTGLVTPGIVDVTGAREVPDEEWFGPLLQVIRVPDFDAAIKAANATRYGLAAGLLSNDAALWQQFHAQVRAGVVNWNRPTTGASSSAPFGGIGKSGNHRPSAYYAADYCSFPVASIEHARLEMPQQVSPGLLF